MTRLLRPSSGRIGGLPLVGTLALALMSVSAVAQPFETPPEPGAPRPLQIATPQELRLPNGLRVVVAERSGVPLVTVRLVVGAGAEADPPQRAGLAAMTAGLLTRGTVRRSAPELAAAAEALGGSLASSAGWDEAGVGITVTTPMLGRAVGLVAEAVRRPAFAPAEIDRLREQSLDELKVAYSQPGAVASMAVQNAYYAGTAYGHPANGTPASLPRIRRDDVLQLHRDAWRPDRAVLVFAGDIRLKDAAALARRHFGDWRPAPGSRPPRRPVPLAAPAATPPVVVDMVGAGQAAVAVMVPAVPAAAPGRFAATVANAVLGLGYSSRLNQEIRIKRGLSYGARSVPDLRRDTGTLRVAVQTQNATAAEVVQLIGAELDGLAQRPVPEDELQARKAALIGGFGRGVETTAGLADEVGALALAGLPMADLTERIARLEAVGPADVQGFAKAHLEPARRRIAVAGEAKEFSASLPARDGWRTVPVDQLDLEMPRVSRSATGTAPR